MYPSLWYKYNNTLFTPPLCAPSTFKILFWQFEIPTYEPSTSWQPFDISLSQPSNLQNVGPFLTICKLRVRTFNVTFKCNFSTLYMHTCDPHSFIKLKETTSFHTFIHSNFPTNKQLHKFTSTNDKPNTTTCKAPWRTCKTWTKSKSTGGNLRNSKWVWRWYNHGD